MKRSTIKFAIAIAIILLSLPFAKSVQAQSTNVDHIYIDNNHMVTYSALLDHIPAKMTIKGAKVNIPQGVKQHATVELNYPVTAITQIYREGDKFRVVVWGIRFGTQLMMPVEAFAMSGHRLTRNKERLISVRILRNFFDSYFATPLQ